MDLIFIDDNQNIWTKTNCSEGYDKKQQQND